MKEPRLGWVYGVGLLLAGVLFVLHAGILFETAHLISLLEEPVRARFGFRVVGIAVVLFAFMILFVSHLVEAAVWACFFWRKGLFESFGAALYFSGTSLSTLGYGDIVLVKPWRGLGPIMATNGILMYGCSTAFLFFVMQRVWQFL